MPQLSSLLQVKEFQFWLFQSISFNEIRWEVCANLEVDVQIEMEDKNAYLKTSVNIFALVVNIPYFRGLFFLSGISFMTIYESQDYGGRGREFHFSNSNTTSTRFTDTQTLVEQLLQRAYLCTQVAAGRDPGTFRFQAQVANY